MPVSDLCVGVQHGEGEKENMSAEQPKQPEFYVDAFNLGFNPYTVFIQLQQHSLGLRPGDIASQTMLCTTRMSPALAKVMAILLRRVLIQYEKDAGPINISKRMLEELKITEQDW